MKRFYFMMVLMLCVAVVGVYAITPFTLGLQGETITDPLKTEYVAGYWYSSANATPASHGVYGDPLGPDDGWLVQDNTNNCRWNYVMKGWTKITAVRISQIYYSASPGYETYYFYGADSNNTELPNKTVTPGSTVGAYTWQTVSYSNLENLNLRWLHINGTLNNWAILAGTVQFDTAPILGNLITANTVDRMHDTSKWYDADTLTDAINQRPGNITITTGVLNDPLDPTPGEQNDACGFQNGMLKYEADYWASYKTANGKYFKTVSFSFARIMDPAYGYVPDADVYLQYRSNGGNWVKATPASTGGPFDSSSHTAWKWFTRTYNLSGMNVNEIRVYGYPGLAGDAQNIRIGTVDMTICDSPADLNCDGSVNLNDFALFAEDWLQ